MEKVLIAEFYTVCNKNKGYSLINRHVHGTNCKQARYIYLKSVLAKSLKKSISVVYFLKNKMKGGEFLLDLLSCAVSVASTYWLYAVLLDPNREASKRAVKAKKDIAKRLGRPHIKTNSYEVHLYFLIIGDGTKEANLLCGIF